MARTYDVIDAHTHYWEPERPDRPWDRSGFEVAAPLSAEQLLADGAKAGVTKIVQVTPTIMGFDNRYGIECAERYPDRIVGVFGRFDVTSPNLGERLEALKRQPRILGLRLTLNKPPWDEWLATGVLEPFWREIERVRVPVAITAADEAPRLMNIARRYPKARILLDHMGVRHGRFGPTAKSTIESFAHWGDVLALARCPNVYVKVSCFPEVSHEPYPFANIHAAFEDLCEAFGSSRLIWGSNYPASAPVCTYRESVDYVDTLSFLNEADKANIFGRSLLAAVDLA